VKLLYETQYDESDTATEQELASRASFLLVCVFVRAVIRRRNVKWMECEMDLRTPCKMFLMSVI